MNPFRQAMLRLRAIVARPVLENDMQEEMREHLERATERYIARGMSPHDARLAARREFGNVAVIQEEGRDARGARWLDAIAGDLRFAFRYFARRKGMVAIIVAVIALGTGANTMIFSIFQSEFLRPAPGTVKDPARVRIWAQERPTQLAQWRPRDLSQTELDALAARRDVFTDVAAWRTQTVVMDVGDSTGARGVSAQFVTPNFFSLLDVRLVAGQGFQRSANTADMTAVLTLRSAEQLYGSAAAAIGKQILVNEMPMRVVGVAPERFQGAVRNQPDPTLWIPVSARADIARISPRWMHDESSLAAFARLAPGASREQATAFVRQVVTGALPDSAGRIGMARTALVDGMESLSPARSKEMALAFTFMSGIGILILLVAWMNVSSLMVAAAVSRRHEISVRLSLGATRVRLLRQLVTESTLVAVAGASVGLMVAWWLLTYMQKTEIDGVDIIPDLGTLAFSMGLALVTGIVFGLSPALHGTRGAVATAMRESGAGTTGRARLQRGFVAAQIALSMPLLVILGTMLSAIISNYKPVAPELSRQVIAVEFKPLHNTGGPAQRAEAVDSVVPRIASRPEVRNAAPDATGFDVRGLIAPDRANLKDTLPSIVSLEGAAPGWFALVDVPIILGRDVAYADTAAAGRPVVIGSDLAQALWGGANPIGRRLASPPVVPGQDSISVTVVGVYDATAKLPGMTFGGGGAAGDVTKRVYTAHGKQWRHDRVLVRTRAAAAPVVPELQQFVREIAPALPMTGTRTLEEEDAQAYRDMLRMSTTAGAAGALALLLASLGLYGVVSLAVQQRKREIGVRMAIGATASSVVRMFLLSGVKMSAAALLIGLPLSIAALKIGMSQGVLIAPEANPYLIGLAIAAILVLVAAAATWVPARRAAHVDPATTLRVE